jgi:hypothetical protein
MEKFLMITAPATVTDSPLSAPAVIKSLLKDNYDYRFIDFNAEFNHSLSNKSTQIVNNYFLYNELSLGSSSIIAKYIDECVRRTIKENPNWIGISLFSYQCQRFVDLFTKRLKTLAPHIKILIGGPGIYENGIEGDRNIGETLHKQGAIDLYIVGEAETQLLIKLKTLSISNEWHQELNGDIENFPDFTDYNFSLFKNRSIPITGSRGCVRKCTFCDIHTHWKKFVFRSGKNIFNEMYYQHKLHNVNHFTFTDSLINGSMKAYRDLITELSNYNKTAKVPFSWESQFIARSESQMNAQDWILTKQSGVKSLFIGVENLNEHIRDHMKKKFSNKDLFFVLDQAKKNKINLTFLMICGYITETEEDHRNQIKIFEELVEYRDILEISLGTTLGILPGTPLYKDHKKYGIVLGESENDWTNPSINNTFENRLRWRSELEEKLIDLGYNLNKNNEQHLLLESWK